jgi:hypothetical protein
MVVRPVSAGYYHRYRRGIAIPLANTDTDTNTKDPVKSLDNLGAQTLKGH